MKSDQMLIERESLIEAILLLHSIATSAADIAQQLHIDQATCLHVIQTGTLPHRQLPLMWREEHGSD
ncbi:MAG: hypothetical protein ABGZ53_23160 [Fuerstiella sp.]